MSTSLTSPQAANDYSNSIQTTTKSVHAETVRVVDEQMKDLDVQMRDLDDFVSRAKSQNAEHHEQHAGSVRTLTNAVDKSFSNIMEHCKETVDRVQDIGEEMEAETNKLQQNLDPLDEDVCQPLSNLRDDIKSIVLQEYQPTGDTPQRIQYQYPTSLPRTHAPEVLLADIRDSPTPSKAAPAVFSDPNLSPSIASPSRLSIASEQAEIRNPLSMSLREMNPNVTTGSLMFEPSASMMSLPVVNDNTVPAAKRSTRSRLAKKKVISTVAEGLENVPPSAFAQSLNKRKSPRLN